MGQEAKNRNFPDLLTAVVQQRENTFDREWQNTRTRHKCEANKTMEAAPNAKGNTDELGHRCQLATRVFRFMEQNERNKTEKPEKKTKLPPRGRSHAPYRTSATPRLRAEGNSRLYLSLTSDGVHSARRPLSYLCAKPELYLSHVRSLPSLQTDSHL